LNFWWFLSKVKIWAHQKIGVAVKNILFERTWIVPSFILKVNEEHFMEENINNLVRTERIDMLLISVAFFTLETCHKYEGGWIL
jgi:hypothetical protein